MKRDDAAQLLERIGVLRSRCDLDLLLFFARHPTALLTSEQLANWLGHELKAIAASLDVLQQARLIERHQNPSHAARMYVFRADRADPAGGGWLPSLLRLAKTREGRLALLATLSSHSAGGAESSTSSDLPTSSGAGHAPTLAIVRSSDGPENHDGPKLPDRKSRHG